MSTKVKMPRKGLRPSITVLIGFIGMIAIGTFFIALPISSKSREWMSFTDALFTAASAVCVTGLTVLSPAVDLSIFGQVTLLLLIQAGGLGFMTLTTLLFITLRRRITLKDRIAIQQTMGEKDMKGIVRLVRNIALMTLTIEFVGFIVIMPFTIVKNGAIGVWQALFTSVSAFCNAGFDIFGTPDAPYQSMTGFATNGGVLFIVGTLVVLGGIGFTVINDVLKSRFRWKRFSLNTKIVLITTLSLLTFGTFFFLGSEFNSPSMAHLNGGQRFMNAIFQSITSRTAGYNAIEQAALNPASKVITAALMFVGASPCGTGGGIKTTTLALTVIMMIAGIRGKATVVINMRTVDSRQGLKAVSIVALALFIVFTFALVILLIERGSGIGASDIFFEVFSAFGTVGLSTGITAALSTASKMLIAILMLVGRLGVVTVGMIFQSRTNDNIKYPAANIMLG